MRVVTNENEKLVLGGVLRGCLYMLVVFVAAVLIQFIIIERNEVEHRKEHPNAAKINNEIAPEYAKNISDALNRYFADHKEYPWQIYGGKPGNWPPPGKEKSIDPLLAGGYLAGGYPRHYHHNGISTGLAIINLVSAPHDAVMENITSRYPTEPIKPSKETGHNPESIKREMERYENYMVEYRERLARYKKFRASVSVLFAAGGIKPSSDWLKEYVGNPGPEPCIVLPGIQEEMIYLYMLSPNYPPALALSCNFGYVRGERMGADKKTAFLWIYGRPSSPVNDIRTEVLGGLDVLNAETGELKPDGIPDGVVLLYELRDGKVVKTTRAEEM